MESKASISSSRVFDISLGEGLVVSGWRIGSIWVEN
jgi:hypothetical protein